jgi:TPR repeat protein
MSNLGVFHGKRGNTEEARRWLQRAAYNGDEHAKATLARVFGE